MPLLALLAAALSAWLVVLLLSDNEVSLVTGEPEIDPGSPNNAQLGPRIPRLGHLAYPGADLQIEVYSPDPGEALRLASRGEVQPVP